MDELSGLSAAQARERLASDGPNTLPEAEHTSPARMLWAVVREPMVLLLLAAGAIYLALGDPSEALMLLTAVVGVIALTLSQEIRSQRALEALRDLSAPRVLVLRDGNELRIPSAELVVGDVVILREGDRVPADALLIDGQVRADESLLTGESVPQQKQPVSSGPANAPGEAISSELYAGTLVTQGTGWARVTATGVRSSMGSIGESLRRISEAPTLLQRASAQLVRRVAVVGLTLSVAAALLAWGWDQRPPLESLLLGISLAMAILPEEIPVVIAVFLALGAWRLSRRAILTRRLGAVETLGTITVLAVDKTGTLTHNRMRVAELAAREAAYRDEGELPESLHTLAEFAALATPADPFDPMEKAVRLFLQKHLARTEHEHLDWQVAQAYELSPDMLAMTHAFATDGGHRHLLATKGAPEAVADLCHLDAATLAWVREQVEQMAGRGLRVLGVARGVWAGSDWPDSQHDFHFEFLGLVGFIDPPREDAAEAVATCHRAGIRVVMMTGDHPATARAIAERIGLAHQAEVLTGAEMDALSDEALSERLRRVSVCARVKPQHKLRLVQLLQAQGEVVGMTGDGVNDAPALRAANVGIAMGLRGTDVAREAAAVVLLDDNFASITAGIRQGRLIDLNLRRAIAFVFAVHVPVILLSLVPVLMHWPLLLLPAQIVLMELIIDPACSVFFEAEPAAQDLMALPPREAAASPLALRVLGQGLLRGLAAAVVLVAGTAWLVMSGAAPDEVRTTVFLALAAGVFAQLLRPRPRGAQAGEARNPWLLRISLGVAVLMALVMSVPALREVMQFAPLTPGLAGVALALVGAQWVILGWRRSQGDPR